MLNHDAELLSEALRIINKADLTRRCGAKTRRSTSCRAQALPNRRRCKFHGGASTGPRTPEGKERARQAVLRRWQTFRDQKRPHSDDKTKKHETNDTRPNDQSRP